MGLLSPALRCVEGGLLRGGTHYSAIRGEEKHKDGWMFCASVGSTADS